MKILISWQESLLHFWWQKENYERWKNQRERQNVFTRNVARLHQQIMNIADTVKKEHFSNSPVGSCVCINEKKKMFRKKNNEAIFSTVKLLSIFFFTFMFYKWMNVRIRTSRFKRRERKIIVSIPLEPFIAFGIYVLLKRFSSYILQLHMSLELRHFVSPSWNQLFF